MADGKPTYGCLQFLAGQGLAYGLPWLGRTMDCRVATFAIDPGGESAQRHPTRGIYIFWHEYIAALLMQWQRVPMTLLVGQHRDANWVGHVAEGMGYRLVRGSSSRGGARALRELRAEAATRAIGMTPDGPRGPRRELAAGPVWLAGKLGLPLFCVAIGIAGARRTKTWDQFALPAPGCRIRSIFGPPVTIASPDSRDELESQRISVQRLMDSLHRLADRWAAGEIALPGFRPKAVPGRLWPTLCVAGSSNGGTAVERPPTGVERVGGDEPAGRRRNATFRQAG
jgi:lysophospholipid acyltransferase (LPLAT)-like uncharacterized protein